MKKIVVLIALALISVVPASAQADKRIPSKGLAVPSKGAPFQAYNFTRHAVGEDDVLIDILYSSICHSDVHQTKDHWSKGNYPMVPGHEMVGVVRQVGSKVTKFKVGDYAGVGTMVNSSDKTESYKRENGGSWNPMTTVWTYNAKDPFHDNEATQGGYASNIVVDEDFAILVPKNADLKRVAPLLCAGITVYSPIQFSEVKKGQKVAVAGFGGLGNMAVKFLQDIGADITAIDINENKRAIAQKMGIKFVNAKNANELEPVRNTFDFLLSTVPGSYDPLAYVALLKVRGQMAIVGQPANTDNAVIPVTALPFFEHRFIYGSVIGSLETQQEMVNYCVQKNIYPDVEIIPTTAEALNDLYAKLSKSEGEFRYVMDMKALK